MSHQLHALRALRVAAITFVVAVPTVLLTSTVGAQWSSDHAAADSAAAARAAYARASALLRANDLPGARREIIRAAEAWPTQAAYVWARAVVAAAAHDTADVIGSLERYAVLGLGRDVHADGRFAPYLELPDLRRTLEQLDRNRAPLPNSHIVAALDDSTFFPEGMDHDPRTGRYYVASIRHGTIAEMERGRLVRELLPRDSRPLAPILAVRVDTARDVLWATISPVPMLADWAPDDNAGAATRAALLRIRPADGTIERRWELPPAARGHALGDLAIGPHGDVFVTDSNDPALYRLRPGADTLERLTSPLFRSLQGLAPTPDGRALYLADYSHGLLRLDLQSGRVTRLADAPNSTSLGCDGIAWDRGAVVAVQNGVAPARVMRFALDASGESIVRAEVLDRNNTIADEPTIGAIVGREFVYVANSQWEKYEENGTRRGGTTLTRPVLLAVPLP
jgi:sugar lactone lactonase YvrE